MIYVFLDRSDTPHNAKKNNSKIEFSYDLEFFEDLKGQKSAKESLSGLYSDLKHGLEAWETDTESSIHGGLCKERYEARDLHRYCEMPENLKQLAVLLCLKFKEIVASLVKDLPKFEPVSEHVKVLI